MVDARRKAPAVPTEFCGLWERSAISIDGRSLTPTSRAVRVQAPNGAFVELRAADHGLSAASSAGWSRWSADASRLVWERMIDSIAHPGRTDRGAMLIDGGRLSDLDFEELDGDRRLVESVWERVSAADDRVVVVDDPDGRGRVARVGDRAIGVRDRRSGGGELGALLARRDENGWQAEIQLGRREDSPLPRPVIGNRRDQPGAIVDYDISFAIDAGRRGDGVVETVGGRRLWGRFGAAGVLLRHVDDAGVERFLMDHRSARVIEGGTWGVPGGAINEEESWAEGALREACEELGVPALSGTIVGSHRSDPVELVADAPAEEWSYTTTVLNVSRSVYELETTRNWESDEHRWVTRDELRTLELHPGFGASLGALLAIVDTAS